MNQPAYVSPPRPSPILPAPALDPPYSRLMRGIVEVHLNDYLRIPKNVARSKHGRCRRSLATRLHDEAGWWFFNDLPQERDYCLSFPSICKYLGWSVDYVRRGVAEAHDRAERGEEISVIIERAVL